MRAVEPSTALTKFITAPLATARTGLATIAAAIARVVAAIWACSALACSTEPSTLSAASPVLAVR